MITTLTKPTGIPHTADAAYGRWFIFRVRVIRVLDNIVIEQIFDY